MLFTKLQFQQKLSPVVHFVHSSSKTWLFVIIYQNDTSKNEISNNFKSSLLQAKKKKRLVIPLQKIKRDEDGSYQVLFWLLQQNIKVELHAIKGFYFGLVCSLHGCVDATAQQYARSQKLLVVNNE